MASIFSPLTIIFFFLLVLWGGEARDPFACDPKNAATSSLPFCKASLAIAERVKDLIGRLTMEEKVGLLVNNAAAVPRLGIKGYEWWSEALHGVSNVGPGTKFGGQFPAATSFPQVITTAASFNASLWEAIGRVASDEARAMYNGGTGGLTYWSPNVNIFRDPRWGRGQETPGEDPILAGKYAGSYVRGLQGSDGERLKVAASCKHFTAYDLDNWKGVDRFHFNAEVSKQDMEDTFNVPFRMCVKEGKVASVMCSYNQVNGVPTCADPILLNTTLRGLWGLNGYIVSDCDSVGVFYNAQHYTSTPEQAAAAAIQAGQCLDLDCGPFLAQHTHNAVKKGLLREAHVNGALANTLTVQMRLGMYEGEQPGHPYANLGPKDVCSPSNQDLAHEAARQGIVLLKNKGPSLPLSTRRHRTLAVIGPNSNATVTMIGNYAGIACGYTSPLQGIGKYTKTIHELGCSNVACTDDKQFGRAINAAQQADATVLVMGLDQSIEAETVDRVGLLLPGHQQDLVSKVASASKGPTILVIMSGGPVDITFAKNDPRIQGIFGPVIPVKLVVLPLQISCLEHQALLPMTWYPEGYVEKLAMTNMAMRSKRSKGYPGRTYRFYSGPVVYSFGYGLYYTHFVHTLVSAPKVVSIPVDGHRHNNSSNIANNAVKVTHARCAKLSISLQVDVKNVGSRDATHTLLVFSAPPAGNAQWAPHKQLVAFHKLHLPAKAQDRVRINIHVCKLLSVVDRSGTRRVPMGLHTLHIADIKHTLTLHPHINS
ncbi:hypothetical protein ACSQ67_015360 [Phaseolus vulgaris]